MNVEQMKAVLREILVHTDLTPCVVGHRGVGKTAGIAQVCRELGRPCIPLRLGQMEVGDLVGLPYREGEVMHWSRPSWWPGPQDPASVIHCDELNRAQQEDTLQAIFQFVEPPAEGQGRRLHTHCLDGRHRVVVAINPPDGTYQVAPLDRALIDRMIVLQVETDPACWADYARSRGLHEDVRSFVAASPGLLSSEGSDFALTKEPSERAWEMVSQLRRRCRFSPEVELEVYAGVVGLEAAASFLQWCADRQRRPLSAEQILNGWDAVAEQARSQRDDLQSATLADVASHLRCAQDLTPCQEKALVAYLQVLPQDLKFALVKTLARVPLAAELLCREDLAEGILGEIEQIAAEAG